MNEDKFSQTHPVMAVARNIVNQLLDQTSMSVEERQALNDDADQFVARLLEEYVQQRTESVRELRDKWKQESAHFINKAIEGEAASWLEDHWMRLSAARLYYWTELEIAMGRDFIPGEPKRRDNTWEALFKEPLKDPKVHHFFNQGIPYARNDTGVCKYEVAPGGACALPKDMHKRDEKCRHCGGWNGWHDECVTMK